jgi:hypothetical protein
LEVRKEILMIRKILTKAAFIMCLFIWNGCVSEPGVLERNWGRAHETAKYNQILHPDAKKKPTPVEGLDGQGAENIIDTYRKGFETNKGPAVYDINIPGIVGK